MAIRQLDHDLATEAQLLENVELITDSESAANREKKLLSLRAKAIANRDKLTIETAKEDSVLIFKLGDEPFAVRMTSISEVVALTKLTTVPGCDPKMMGIMAIKGEVHCIFDLCRVLELPFVANSSSQKITGHILVLRMPGYHVGLCVDHILAIDHIGLDEHQSSSKENGSGRRLVRPRQATPLILIENFQNLLGTLIQGEQAQ